MFSRFAPFLLPVLLALPACATSEATGDAGAGAVAPTEATSETTADLKGGPLFDDAAFPMSAADFTKKLDERRAKMESFGKKHRGEGPKGDAPEDAARRAKFEERRAEQKAKIDAKIAAVTADGTVTLDEAKELRATFMAGHGGPGHRGHGGPGGDEHGRGPGHGRGGADLAEMTFPITAEAFRAKVDGRRQEMKARFEEHAKDMPAERVTEMRARIAETEAKFDAKLAEITADGTVTKDEAEALRGVLGAGRPRPER
jgi:hypothetical protein